MISVTEDIGVVEVCAVVISGDLERDVSFTLNSADGTAIGKLVIASSLIPLEQRMLIVACS